MKFQERLEFWGEIIRTIWFLINISLSLMNVCILIALGVKNYLNISMLKKMKSMR